MSNFCLHVCLSVNLLVTLSLSPCTKFHYSLRWLWIVAISSFCLFHFPFSCPSCSPSACTLLALLEYSTFSFPPSLYTCLCLKASNRLTICSEFSACLSFCPVSVRLYLLIVLIPLWLLCSLLLITLYVCASVWLSPSPLFPPVTSPLICISAQPNLRAASLMCIYL